MNLHGEMAFALAERIAAAGLAPRDRLRLSRAGAAARARRIARVEKPCDPETVVARLATQFEAEPA